MLTTQTNKETLQIQKMIDEDVFLICWCLFYLHVFSEVAAHCVLSGTVVWCNFRKHRQIEKAPANQENNFINLTAGARFRKEVEWKLSM